MSFYIWRIRCAPLPKKCPRDQQLPISIDIKGFGEQDDQNSVLSQGFYLSMGVGFVAGFCGMLLSNKNWKYSHL